jgi:predicted Zn-ribbon and HTH transcriptional regulator
MPAPIARGAAEKDEGGPRPPLAIVLSCPKCGAPFSVDDSVVTVSCTHCASLLILTAPDRDEIYIADGVTKGADDIREIVIRSRVQSERAEIVSRHTDSEGNPPSEFFVQMRLEAFERRMRDCVQVVDAHRLEAPYWHLTGKLVQAVVGRQGEGPKVVRLRAWEVEHTVPGYDVATANLRDRGLRLAQSHVRPLTAKDLVPRGPFLPWAPVAPQSYREIDKWKGRDLESGLEAVTRQAGYIYARRVLVYRPYWLARVRADGPLVWVLVDGSFDGIAGHPDEDEARSLLTQAVADPLRSTGETYRRVTIAASRCPDCGFEAAFDRAAHVSVCTNCHLGLAPSKEGVRVVPYSHARFGEVRLDADYVPFWRFRFQAEIAGAAPLGRLEDYARALFPQALPPGFAPRGPYLWVPALRLLGTEIGDETFQALVRWIHGAALEVEDGKIPVGGTSTAWPATVSEAQAREAAAFVPIALHGTASAARLNTMLVTRAILKAKVTLSAPRLVAVPFARAADEALHAPGAAGASVRVAPLLLRGGPALDAQRATVHRALQEPAGWPRIPY